VRGVYGVKPKITIVKLLTPPGDDKLKFKGSITIPPQGGDPALDPVSEGARAMIVDSTGTVVLDVTIPPGAYQTANTHFVVDRRGLRATLYRDGKAVFNAPVGVGTASWPTPAGEFLVRSELTRYASPFYGPVAFGTSARSAVLTDWPAGGFVGIHGTSEPQLLPGRVSHGCIRMRNPDILRLAELMPVGTPLTIQ